MWDSLLRTAFQTLDESMQKLFRGRIGRRRSFRAKSLLTIIQSRSGPVVSEESIETHDFEQLRALWRESNHHVGSGEVTVYDCGEMQSGQSGSNGGHQVFYGQQRCA